jgi:hypothetical protein
MSNGPLRPVTRPLPSGISTSAVSEADRFGWGGAWCGRDFYDADGREVGHTLTAAGNPSGPETPAAWPKVRRAG